MKRMKGVIAVIAIVIATLLATLAFSCVAPAPKEKVAPEKITIVDSVGRYVEVPQPLEKIIPLNSDAAEAIRLLGEENKVVGVGETITKYPSLFPKMKEKPVIGGWKEVNYEKIAEVGPQAVVSYVKWPDPKELEDKLKPFGIKVIHLDFYKIEPFDRELRTLALILGKEDRANEFISWRHRYTDLVKGRVKEIKSEEKVQVYMEMELTPWKALGPGSGADQILRMAGGKNICGELHVTYPEVDEEWVLKKNPEVIIKTAYELRNPTVEKMKSLKERVLDRVAIKETKAAKERRVYIVKNEVLGGGPRCSIGVCYLAKVLYPELFKQLDVGKIHREYWEKFLSLPYRVITIYPEFE